MISHIYHVTSQVIDGDLYSWMTKITNREANGSSLLLISFNGFPITVFGNDARVCKPYNEFINCKSLVISYCFLAFYELFQFIEGLILF